MASLVDTYQHNSLVAPMMRTCASSAGGQDDIEQRRHRISVVDNI
jgi:hypothetical protein